MTVTWQWQTVGKALNLENTFEFPTTITDGIIIPAGTSLQRVIARGCLGMYGAFASTGPAFELTPYNVELHYYLTGAGLVRKPIHDSSYALQITFASVPDGSGGARIDCYGSAGPFYFDAEARKLSPPPPEDELILNLEMFINPLFIGGSMNQAWMQFSYGQLWTQYLTSTPE